MTGADDSLSGADDSSAQTTDCADAEISRRQFVLAKTTVWLATAETAIRLATAETAVRQAETTVFFGGCRDVGLEGGDDSLLRRLRRRRSVKRRRQSPVAAFRQAETAIRKAETTECGGVWARPIFFILSYAETTVLRRRWSAKTPVCGDDSSSAQTTLRVNRTGRGFFLKNMFFLVFFRFWRMCLFFKSVLQPAPTRKTLATCQNNKNY